MALAKLNDADRWAMDGARKKIDHVMRDIIDQIDNAYYGSPNPDNTRQKNGWRHGVSHRFFAWDYVEGEDNARKFAMLSGIIHHFTFLVQHAVNTQEQNKYPHRKYNEMRTVEGALYMRPDGVTPKTRVWDSKQQIKIMMRLFNKAGLTPQLSRKHINSFAQLIKDSTVMQKLAVSGASTINAVLDFENDVDVT